MGSFEVEQKYRLREPSKIRALLKKIKARKIAGGPETNEFYDRAGLLKKQKVALRLRCFGKGPAVLTLKGPRIKNKFTKRIEIEAPIEYATARAVLGLAGFLQIGQYRKQRDVYRLGRTLVVIDRLKKFGWFLEIEGRGRDIAKVAAKLGLHDKDREERSYLQMVFGWKH